MNVTPIVKQLDKQISELQSARDILSTLNGSRGRPRKHRTMSAAARRRISQAQKKRWRLQKKAA